MLPTTASHSTVRGLQQQQSEETDCYYQGTEVADHVTSHTEPHLETVSSVSRRLRLAREIALLSGSGNTGAMWRTSGDPGCSLTNHSSAALLSTNQSSPDPAQPPAEGGGRGGGPGLAGQVEPLPRPVHRPQPVDSRVRARQL